MGNVRPCLLVDTDVDLDDAMALLYSCEVDVGDLRAVTVTGNGFALTSEQGVEVVRRLLQMCSGSTDSARIAVAPGRNQPLSNTSFAFPLEWRLQAWRFFLERLPRRALDDPAPQAASSSTGASPAALLIVETA